MPRAYENVFIFFQIRKETLRLKKIIKKKKKNYLFEKESASTSGEGAEGEGECQADARAGRGSPRRAQSGDPEIKT